MSGKTRSSDHRPVSRSNRAGLMGHHIIHGRNNSHGRSPPTEVIVIPDNQVILLNLSCTYMPSCLS